jgi:hypothetical protein
MTRNHDESDTTTYCHPYNLYSMINHVLYTMHVCIMYIHKRSRQSQAKSSSHLPIYQSALLSLSLSLSPHNEEKDEGKVTKSEENAGGCGGKSNPRNESDPSSVLNSRNLGKAHGGTRRGNRPPHPPEWRD